MSRDRIVGDLGDLRPTDFVAKYIFDVIPHVFGSREVFVSWKINLAEKLDVDPLSLVVVGSAAVGISLNPHKNFRPFHDGSDIDVAVISYYHFNQAWRALRAKTASYFRGRYRQKEAWEEHRTNLVFRGTIATDKILGLLPFATQWNAAATHASKNVFLADRSVGFRLYADYDSLRSYQVHSVKKAQDSLSNKGV